MTTSIEIQPAGPTDGSIRPPGSKSLTNRALVCAALARGESVLTGVLESEDTGLMIDALRQLGIAVGPHPNPLPTNLRSVPVEGTYDTEKSSPHPNPLAKGEGTLVKAKTMRVSGCNGRPPAAQANLFAGNSGTTIRFLTAMAALGRGRFRLDGTPRMRERPIQDLLDALEQLGTKAYSELGSGCPPVVVEAAGLRGGRAEIAGNVSSQFLSGLLMAAAYAENPVELVLRGPLVSQPYAAMTTAVMAAFGVQAEIRPEGFIVPAGVGYHGRIYDIEPDASAASYFFAAAAITGGKITVEGLSRQSLQGDVAFCDCLEKMGCAVEYGKNDITVRGGKLRGIDADMNAISDTVQTLAAVALFARGPTTISRVAHIRHKETDRIHALAVEMRKIGAGVEERPDGLRIIPDKLRGTSIETYNDHRMAMSMALVGLAVPGIVIMDPECTAKTYPDFFADLARIIQKAERGTRNDQCK